MSVKATFAAFVVLLAAVSSQGSASAQVGPAGEKSEPSNRVKSKPPFNARASKPSAEFEWLSCSDHGRTIAFCELEPRTRPRAR